jgi:glycosyltransferase 2 family protein
MKKAIARLFSSRITQTILGLVIGLVCLYLSLRDVDWLEVRETIRTADPFYICLAICFTVANIAIKIFRWQIQLKQYSQNIPLRDTSAAFLSAQMLNALVPIRLGEIQRIYVIGRAGSTHGFVLGTILVEKFLDMLAYGLSIVMLLFWIPLPEWMGASITVLITIALIQAVLLFILSLKRDDILRLVESFSRHFSPTVRDYLLKNTHSGFVSFDILRQPLPAMKLSLSTALIWSTAVLTNYWIMLAVDIQVPLAASLLVLVVAQAGISFPSLPGKIGVFELACILALGVFGVDRAIALSYGILLHTVVLVPILISGLISFIYLQIEGIRPVP